MMIYPKDALRDAPDPGPLRLEHPRPTLSAWAELRNYVLACADMGILSSLRHRMAGERPWSARYDGLGPQHFDGVIWSLFCEGHDSE